MLRLVLALAVLWPAAALAQLPAHPALDAPRTATADRSGDAFDLATTWVGGPAWMAGVDIDMEAYGGSLARGRFFVFGNETTTAADDVPVEIRFDPDQETLATVFRADQSWTGVSVGTFPGSVWDTSDPSAPRRLNVAFTERGDSPNTNGTWDPDATSQGNLELLLVMDSDYDGTGEAYLGADLFTTPIDMLYGWFPRLAPGRTFMETAPAALRVDFAFVRNLSATADDGTVTLTWDYALADGAAFRVLRAQDDGDAVEVADVPIGDRTFTDPGLDAEPLYRYRVVVVDAAGEPVHTSAEVALRATRRQNVDLVGVYDERSGYADVWGYTAPDGREYALVALQTQGLVVVDVTDDVPVEVGFVPTAADANDSKDVKVYGDYAYLVNESGPLQIISLADPTDPQQVALLYNDPAGLDHGSHNLLVANDHLWLTGGPAPGGLQVFDLVDPEAPQLVGGFQPFYYHDFEIRDGIGFGPGIYGDGVDVLDVSDPTDISLITRFNYPGSGAHNTCTTEDLSHVYVGDEIGSAGNWTRVFDLADYQNENVEFVGDIVVDAAAAVHNCYVRGDVLYVAHYTEGLQIFDVSTPAAPVRVGFFDTFTDSGYGYNGAWSVYPYFESGNVVVSDRNYGLFVLAPDLVVDAEGGPRALDLALTSAPNPAADRARLSFSLPAAADVSLVVYDVRGREVARLADGALPAGPHQSALDTSALPSGVYLARLVADGLGAATRTVVVAH